MSENICDVVEEKCEGEEQDHWRYQLIPAPIRIQIEDVAVHFEIQVEEGNAEGSEDEDLISRILFRHPNRMSRIVEERNLGEEKNFAGFLGSVEEIPRKL